MTIGSGNCAACTGTDNAVQLAVAVKAQKIARSQAAQVLELLEAATTPVGATPQAEAPSGHVDTLA